MPLRSGLGNTALAVGKNTTALAAGTFNLAADIGENESSVSDENHYKDTGFAIAAGTFNSAINVGNNNKSISTNPGEIPTLDPLNVGGNRVINVGSAQHRSGGRQPEQRHQRRCRQLRQGRGHPEQRPQCGQPQRG